MIGNISKSLKILPTDYEEYGGEVKRWSNKNENYPDCSVGCKFFIELKEPFSNDWGVCVNPNGPRKGLLTFEHMAGYNCFEENKNG